MSGLSIKYKELFRLSIGQNFYQNGICRKYTDQPAADMLLVPTADTEGLMKKLDILYRPDEQSGGITVLARVLGTTAAGNDLLRFKVVGADKLSFYSYLRNADMLQFNELPVNHNGNNVYYFSNEQTNAGAPRNNLHLTATAAGVDGNTDIIKKTGPDYRFQQAASVAQNTAFVVHLLSGIRISANSVINNSGGSHLQFDLAGLPVGRCELQISGVMKEQFCYLGETAAPVFALVEVLLSQALLPNYKVVEGDQSLRSDRPLYTISFLKRSTFWKYTILLAENSPVFRKMAVMNAADQAIYLSNLAIVTNDPAISFAQQSATSKEIVFVSATPLALQEKYFSSGNQQEALILTLKENTGLLNEAILRASLPYPAPNKIDARALPTIYSDILITL